MIDQKSIEAFITTKKLHYMREREKFAATVADLLLYFCLNMEISRCQNKK